MSGHPLSIPHDRKTGVLSEKALQGTSTYRATRWQAKALQTHRPAMREDCAELPFLCRACVRPYTAQIRPHCLVPARLARRGDRRLIHRIFGAITAIPADGCATLLPRREAAVARAASVAVL